MKKLKSSLLRNSLWIMALLFFGLVLIVSRDQLKETRELLKNVNLWAALLLPLIQLTSYFFISGYYRSFISVFGKSVNRARAFGSTLALNFVNQILPSGGASGTTYMVYAFKDAAMPGQLTLIQLGRYLFSFISYVPLLIVAYVWLAFGGELNSQLELALGVLAIIALPGTVLIVMAIRSQAFVDRLVEMVIGFTNRIIRFFTRKSTGPLSVHRDKGFLKEFNSAVAFLKEQRGHLLVPYLYMQTSTLLEVTLVNTAFWVLGAQVNPAAILLAFTAANIAGAISIIPGDVGVHELAVITVLSYVGVDPSIALAGALLYRVFNKLIVMGIGFIAYVRLLKPLVKNARAST